MLGRVAVRVPFAANIRQLATSAGASQVTQLPNGLRVVTDNTPHAIPSIAVVIGGGSSSVDFRQSGLAHLVARAAFQGTAKRSALRQIRDVEDIGAEIKCESSRDDLVYSGRVQQGHLSTLVQILGEAVTAPRIVEREIEDTVALVQHDAQVLQDDALAAGIEQLHAAAFRERGLGLPSLVPQYTLGQLTASDVHEYRKRNFVAGNVVVAASGVEHESFVRLISNSFAQIASGSAPATIDSKYIGGEVRLPAMSDTTTVGIALPGVSVNDSKAAAFSVLAAALGSVPSYLGRLNTVGYGASSAIGQLLTKQSSIHQARSFSSSYVSGGLFGVVALVESDKASAAFEGLIAGLKSLTSLNQEAVNRAKARVARDLLSSGVSATAVSLGRQALFSKTVLSSEELAARVNGVTAADVAAAAKASLARPPTVAVVGNVPAVPLAAEVAASLK